VAEQNCAEGASPNTVLCSLAAEQAAYIYRLLSAVYPYIIIYNKSFIQYYKNNVCQFYTSNVMPKNNTHCTFTKAEYTTVPLPLVIVTVVFVFIDNVEPLTMYNVYVPFGPVAGSAHTTLPFEEITP